MASKDQPSVVRRTSRGRTAIDAKTKTDSGCFLDDDVDKQTQLDKSPPGNKGESKFVKIKREDSNETISDVNKINALNKPLVNGNSQNAAAEGGEMNQSNERLNNEETRDDSRSSLNSSTDDTRPKEDFYCLYYSDSPNGSLTRKKDKKPTSKFDYEQDVAARAEELLGKVKSEAVRNAPRSPDAVSKDGGLPSPKGKGPPVAPKPKRNPKQSNKPSRDPILDELDKLGTSVGRDFGNVNGNDPSLFSNAVKQLQVAQTPEDCIERFDAIQTALLEDVPDTLERKKAKNAKEDPRRKSFPGADPNPKTRKLSGEVSRKGSLVSPESKTKTTKKAESPKSTKSTKTKFEVKAFSRSERESLHSMKTDSHKRSHLNSDSDKPPSTRCDACKVVKSEAAKRLADKIENKTNLKKDKKPSPPQKAAKISKKVTTSPTDEKSNSNSEAKRKERLEFRSGRRRINGDLSSIPEDAIIGAKNDSLNDDKAIPLAKGEEDLSSEEDFDMYEGETVKDTADLSYKEMDLPPPPSISTTSTSNTMISKEATILIPQTADVKRKTCVQSSSTGKASRMSSSNSSVIFQSFENPNNHRSKLAGTSVVSQNFQNFKDHNLNPSSQPNSSRRGMKPSSLSSDEWTSESVAGYSSANDADDETERPLEHETETQQDLETSEDFETYEDPEEIVDMTFGDGIVGSDGDEYVYVEETPRQPHRNDEVVHRSNHFRPLPHLQQRDEFIYGDDTPRRRQINSEVVDRMIPQAATNHFQPPPPHLQQRDEFIYVHDTPRRRQINSEVGDRMIPQAATNHCQPPPPHLQQRDEFIYVDDTPRRRQINGEVVDRMIPQAATNHCQPPPPPLQQRDEFIYVDDTPRRRQVNSEVVDKMIPPASTNHCQPPPLHQQRDESFYVDDTPRRRQINSEVVDRMIPQASTNHFQPPPPLQQRDEFIYVDDTPRRRQINSEVGDRMIPQASTNHFQPPPPPLQQRDEFIYVDDTPRRRQINSEVGDRMIPQAATNHFQPPPPPLQQRDEFIYVDDTPRRRQINSEVGDRMIPQASTNHFQPPHQVEKRNNYPLESGAYEMDVIVQEDYQPEYYEHEVEGAYYQNHNDPNLIVPTIPAADDQSVVQTRQYDNQDLERYEVEDVQAHQNASQRPSKKIQEQGPDPSGFMTVQDIKRLIFQGRNPATPRSNSFCGTPSSSTWRRSQEGDSFHRQSWSGYSARQQLEPGIDPLVRKFPQTSSPVEEVKKSPYVRTVEQKSRHQPDHYSDSNLATAVKRERRPVNRSHSFCATSLQRRANSFDGDHLQVVDEESESGRRSRSFSEAPLQRRAKSLDGYYSSNRVSPGIQTSGPTARQLTRRSGLVRTNSDSSSDYSQSDNEQHYEQFRRLNGSPRSFNKPPSPHYIDANELAKLVSTHSAHEVCDNDPRSLQAPQPQHNGLQHGHRGNSSAFPRKSSESLRIQAIRRSSQINSDSDSDVYPDERYKNPPNVQPPKQLTVVTTNPGNPKPKSLSERFSDVPQRVSLEELAQQLNLPDDEDDDSSGGFIVEQSESECGADLEFDFGDYFDDNNMIVGEALRLKKVLGCNTEQDPELEIIVSAATDPKMPPTRKQGFSMQVSQPTQTEESLTLERPPPYHEVRNEIKANSRADSPSYYAVYDTDGSYPSESEYSDYGKRVEKLTVPMYGQGNTSDRRRRDSETLTEDCEPITTAEKAISAEVLLKLLLNSSQGNVNQDKPNPNTQQKQQSTVQNLLFPAPHTKAASTGNIHSGKTFPGHVSQLYGNADLNSAKSTLNRRRKYTPPPKYHKSHESVRRGRPSSTSAVLKAKLVSSSGNVKPRPNGSSGRVFEEEVDCMRTQRVGDFSSSEFSSGSSVGDAGEKKSSPATSVSYVGCEETKQIETLPRVKLSSQRKRRKEKVGFLSDQDIPTVVQNDNQANLSSQKSSEQLTKGLASNKVEVVKPKQEDKEMAEKVVLRKKRVPKIDLSQIIDSNEETTRKPRGAHEETTPVVKSHEIVRFPRDDLPSPNSVNVFIDYKKNVMKVTTSTPKIHHGKLITESPTGLSPVSESPEKETLTSTPKIHHGNLITKSPTGLSPVSGSPEKEKLGSPPKSPKSPKGTNVGLEEIPPKYDSGSSSERSSSVYSSDDEKFFGSNDTVVFVDKTNESGKPTVDVTLSQDQDNEVADTDAYSARMDLLLREARSSLDLDSLGSDLLDQAMERVKDKLSPRSNQATGGITMEAYVALNQADELQALINEIKGELRLLQDENTMLKERVVSLQHGDSCSTSETTEESLTESAERIESIRRQIADVVVDKHKVEKSEDEDNITIDVFLRGFGETIGLKSIKKTDVKLGQVIVQGGTDWTGVYDAAKTTFLDHIKRIDTSSCLGLGPTSMYGAQIGATMLTPETLRKKNPRVEISRRFNSCVIQLKDGMTDNFDTLIYDTLIPKSVVEGLVHQILEHRFIMLCGVSGMGKSHIALRLAEHLAQRFGSKSQDAVLTLSVQEKSRKELKKTLAKLMKCDISTPSDGVPVVVVLDQLDCLASLADVFEPKQLEGNRNSPFIIGVRNKSKKGPFSAKDLAIHKYFRWIQMTIYDRYVLGLLERFLRRKLSWTDRIGNEEDLLDLFIWLTQVWQHINQILLSYVDVEVTIGPSVFYTCPMDAHAAEGWFANVWNYTIIPYLHQNIRNSRKIYERNVPWEDPTKWVIMRWPWSREKSKVLPTLKKLRQVDIVLNRNNMESDKDKKKESRSKLRKLRSNLVQNPSKAGSLESWSTADWETVSATSDDESIATSTL